MTIASGISGSKKLSGHFGGGCGGHWDNETLPGQRIDAQTNNALGWVDQHLERAGWGDKHLCSTYCVYRKTNLAARIQRSFRNDEPHIDPVELFELESVAITGL